MTDDAHRYHLTFTEHPDHLYVSIKSETISDDIIRSYVAEIAKKADETGKDRILLYRDIPQVMKESGVFHAVTGSLETFRGKKIAIVNPHRSLETDIEVGMTVAQNRGANYRSFNNVEDAKEWLLK